jgi:glucose 1-dehydrogenase
VRLGGRVAIVTGGARHIGAAYGRRLATEGAAVVIADILDGGSVAEEIRSTGGRAIALTADVSSERDANRMAAEAVKAFGRIDILVNNAGMTMPSALADRTEAEAMMVLQVNLIGPFLCSQIALLALEPRQF